MILLDKTNGIIPPKERVGRSRDIDSKTQSLYNFTQRSNNINNRSLTY